MQFKGRSSVKDYQADVRLNIWLWLELSKGYANLPMDDFDALNFQERLATRVDRTRIDFLVSDIAKSCLIPSELLEWIVEDKRQIAWLTSYIHKLKFTTLSLSPRLHGRDLIVASIDTLERDLHSKASIVAEMQWHWNENIRGDGIFKWFQGKEEAARCALAWEWLVEKKGAAMYGRERISTYTDLLIFFDGLAGGEPQKKLDIASIKNRWSQKKYRSKMKGKKQYNLLLSDKSIADLDQLALKYGVSRPQIIETLIQYESNRGLYLPEKIRSISWD